MNIINAAFVRNGVTVRTLPVYQYDSGMILNISGLDDLPSTFRADFSNAETGQSKSVIGTDGQVHIPYEYFVPGATIHCWLVWSGEDYTVTRKHIMIPVARRAVPTDEEPTPDEQGVIDQAIAALNDAVAHTGQDVDAAAGYAEQAEQSAQAATDAKDNAVIAKADAESAKDQTVESAAEAAASAQSASESAQSASQSKTSAQEAAASVAGAMDTLEATIQADLQAAKESGEFDGPQGPKGVPGERGEPGEPGADGVTFTPAVSSEGVISWTNNGGKTNPQPVNIKGPTGQTGPQGERGLTGETGPAGPAGPAGATGPAGADGISPTIAVTDITGGHQVTITDATGPHSFDVLDGDAADAPVQDVQVNGTSILDAQGVANVPVASSNNVGAVKIDNNYGIGMRDAPNQSTIRTSPARDDNIKKGQQIYQPITPNFQHLSTFYGLTKAAGVDMASSSNPVGTYTDEAKIAIQKMLGIYEAPWGLIREDTVTNATEADIEITVDGNGQAFELTDVLIVLIIPNHSEDTTIGDYGRIYLYNNTTEIRRIYLLDNASKLVKANSTPQIAIGRLLNNNGLMSIDLYTWNGNSGRTNLQIVPNPDLNGTVTPFAIYTNYINKIKIGKITGKLQYRLFGRRKWQ